MNNLHIKETFLDKIHLIIVICKINLKLRYAIKSYRASGLVQLKYLGHLRRYILTYSGVPDVCVGKYYFSLQLTLLLDLHFNILLLIRDMRATYSDIRFYS